MSRDDLVTTNESIVGSVTREAVERSPDTILIVVTHSKELAARFPQRFELKNQHLETL